MNRILPYPGRKAVIFTFDVVCPYAYIASQRIDQLVEAAKKLGSEVELEWRPVLLGGLYDLTKAPQGKDGSATSVMPENKQKLNAIDLQREAERWGVILKWNSKHPIRSLDAQRLLCALSDEKKRRELAKKLYEAYWVQGEDIADPSVLEKIASQVGVKDASNLLSSSSAKETLLKNTQWAADGGAFGVPSIFVGDSFTGKGDEYKLFFGQDRMHFVALALGVPRSHNFGHPLLLEPVRKLSGAKLTFYHDFSSPWSFLGSTQVRRLAESHGATLEYKPILLGALFRNIGTPNVPMFAMSDAKRNYFAKDMEDWKAFHGKINLRFPDAFPIRTVLPLRVSIVEPKTIDVMYDALWQQNQNIGDEGVLRKVLEANGFDAQSILDKTASADVKETLKKNTEEAETKGACGVPSFEVNDGGEIIWGQDRMNVVSDMLTRAATYSKL